MTWSSLIGVAICAGRSPQAGLEGDGIAKSVFACTAGINTIIQILYIAQEERESLRGKMNHACQDVRIDPPLPTALPKRPAIDGANAFLDAQLLRVFIDSDAGGLGPQLTSGRDGWSRNASVRRVGHNCC